MIAHWDFIVAFGLATGIHLAGLGYHAANGGFEGAGAEGRAALSLQAAPEGISDLVAAWEAVPDVSPIAEVLDAPVSDDTVTKVNLWSDSTVPNATPKLEDAPEVTTAPSIEAEAVPQLAALQQPARSVPDVKPVWDVARGAASPLPSLELPAPTFEAPSTVERAIVATTRPVARPVRSDAAPAVVARGTGSGVSAGNLGETRVVGTLAPAARLATQAGWAAKIQSRIARHQKFPRGARGQGRVRLQMDILADGRLGAVRIDRSSGVAAFDKAALRAAKTAAPFPSAPKGLDQSSYTFAQWVNFSR